MTVLKDAVGNEIKVGDFVRVTMLHSGRGAHQNTLHQTSEVKSLGRTRVAIDVPSLTGLSRIGPECMQVWSAVDDRPLRTWRDVHGEGG
jgi:hypothetical protein